jgi:hypothetical protein
LASSARGLRVPKSDEEEDPGFDIKCAWFNQDEYNENNPVHRSRHHIMTDVRFARRLTADSEFPPTKEMT